MLGNSFTSSNNLPETLARLTGATVTAHTRGGSRLAEHLNPGTGLGAKTLAALEAETWDYVVLQEMSNGPVTSPEKFLQNVHLLCRLIRDKGAEPVLYATWAYQEGGKKLAALGMDYPAMAVRMEEMYTRAAEDNNCLIAQVGKAFYERSRFENLYAEDGCHPNRGGSELAAKLLSEVILEDQKKKRSRISMKEGSFSSIEDAVSSLFTPETIIISKSPVAGGDINAAWSIYLTGGKRIFAKTNTGDKEDMFKAEALSLSALASTGTIGLPRVLGYGRDETNDLAFLLLEHLESAPKNADYWEVFGRELAALHLAETEAFLPREAKGASYGFLGDNFIGSTPQYNSPKRTWVDFYRECRLEPQIRMAEEVLSNTVLRKLIRLLDRLEVYMREPEKPSLLHGDLWSGNQLCGPDGKAWILDPAAYVGDFEADLAMTELFGAFPERFYSSYASVNPVEPEFEERRDLYHLYHMLNHLNLFGEAYLQDVTNIAEQYV